MHNNRYIAQKLRAAIYSLAIGQGHVRSRIEMDNNLGEFHLSQPRQKQCATGRNVLEAGIGILQF